ncbi:MAG: cation:proton antiporter [Cyanobacterium sp. T60_A2020_053]|nr:cation:proton antiporter [Cyanobacterium sp. T60_A2020_053]
MTLFFEQTLISIVLVLLGGFLAGQLVKKIKLPPLLGMILIGIIFGSQFTNILAPSLLDSADNFRTIAVMTILMKAGLGLDREKLKQQGSVALRLGFLPAIFEALVVMILAVILLDFSWVTGLLLGCILSPESPAVIVPGMLRLKSLGWGVKKGIPDAILTGSALSDVLLLLVFSLLINFLSQDKNFNLDSLTLLPIQLITQVVLGVLIGWITAYLFVYLFIKQKWSENIVQETFLSASIAVGLVKIAEIYPIFSGYLAVMSFGFFLIEKSAPLAERLRVGFDSIWKVAEIFLFVLLGANIPLNILGDTLIVGLIILILGTLVGRMTGWYLATWGSNWNRDEKLFLLAGNSAKATVQAAIGALPLSLGIEGGEKILALAGLSILVTAPLGAWAIPTFAPRLLQREEKNISS